MTTLKGRSLHMLLQSSVGWRDVLNRAILCKELLSRLVDILAFACAVILEYYKPLDDMHCILLDACGCICQTQQGISEFWQRVPCCPGRFLPMSDEG